ncbi:hypothetical protein [Novosphingobium sp.]|uniref:hypothetical protein n=1 Tax=Novosphingobium sp. TaxID=1874826 RepID=UPI0025DA70F9|nr:hypothetical protein [Novosphingobium sp.]MCC6926236.1 hypothetical protein [Novosphingobium sp.]
MRIAVTALIFLAGLFNLALGLSFLYDPGGMGLQFGVSPNGPLGFAVLRADFPAFFLVIGFCMLRGAWVRNGDLLLVPAALFAIAFTGRAISALVSGTQPGFFEPMVVEALQFVLLVIGWKVVPHHKIEELTS